MDGSVRIGILGTGVVGQTIGGKLTELGHDVKLGSRTATNEKAAKWVAQYGSRASQGTFADAASFGEVVFNCTSGMVSLEALHSAGAANLAGKVLVDVSNPLDFSHGMPPTLSVCNTDSLGEQLQRAFPRLRVVKTLNTTNVRVMIEPQAVAGGDHTMFVCGNDAAAKADATRWLGEWFGWRDVVDLGDITTARGTEMLLPIWVRLMSALGTPMFNFKIVR